MTQAGTLYAYAATLFASQVRHAKNMLRCSRELYPKVAEPRRSELIEGARRQCLAVLTDAETRASYRAAALDAAHHVLGIGRDDYHV